MLPLCSPPAYLAVLLNVLKGTMSSEVTTLNLYFASIILNVIFASRLFLGDDFVGDSGDREAPCDLNEKCPS